MTEVAETVEPIEKRLPRQVFAVDKISADIDLPPEEKSKLPAPTIISELRCGDKGYSIDIRDHLGREWMLCAKEWRDLRQKLRYFKTLDRALIDSLFVGRPLKPIALSMWCPVKGWRCATCKTPARSDPRDSSRWCCHKCEIASTAEFNIFEQFVEPPKPKKKAAPVESKPSEPAPVPGLSLKERLALRRKAK